MKKKTMYIIISVSVVLGGLLVVISKQRELAALPKAGPQPATVQAAIAEQGTIEVAARQIGEVQPYVQTDLAPRITGHILTVTKREGDMVAKDEVVCTIDDRELQAKAEATQAEVLATRQRLAGARSVYETQRSSTERDEKLYAAGAISKEALERSHTALDTAKAALDAYEESIRGMERNVAAAGLQAAYSQVTAPFSGVVSKRWAEPGDLAVPGKPVLTIQQPSPVKIVVQVPQELMSKIRKGMDIVLSNGSETTRASISRVYPALNKNLLGSLEVVLPKNPFGLPNGSTVEADIVTSTVAGVIVPENALVRTEKGAFVYLLEKDFIHVRQVQVLGAGRGKVAVKGDVPAGAQVAVAQENKLLTFSEGAKVTVAGGKQ